MKNSRYIATVLFIFFCIQSIGLLYSQSFTIQINDALSQTFFVQPKHGIYVSASFALLLFLYLFELAYRDYTLVAITFALAASSVIKQLIVLFYETRVDLAAILFGVISIILVVCLLWMLKVHVKSTALSHSHFVAASVATLCPSAYVIFHLLDSVAVK